MGATAYDVPISPEYLPNLPRYAELQKLRKYLSGTQYDGRPDFFTGQNAKGDEVPLRERKPCVIYPMPRGCIEQVVKFTFGESRFPVITVEKIDPDDALGGVTLTEDEADFLSGFFASLVKNAALRPGMRRTMRQGLSIGATCVLLKLKRGQFRIDLANAEDVFPQFEGGDPAAPLERLTWAYQFNKSVRGEDGKPVTKRFWYRLDVDKIAYTEFNQVEVKPGEPPVWTEAKVDKHSLGFVPAAWVRNASAEGETGIDGFSLYGEFLDEFDALNFALSQRHRGIAVLGVPQPWETGVEDDDGPGATGRQSHGYSPGVESQGSSPSPHGRVSQLNPARRIGGSQMWSYRNDKTRLGLLETTGKAFEVATNHVNDIRSRLLESMGVVIVNLNEVTGRSTQGHMSAKFLELAYEPLLALVDEMRCSWWDGALRPILELLARWIIAIEGKGLLLPGADKAAKLLAKFYVDTTDGRVWYPPSLVPNWGEYFSDSPEDVTAKVAAAIQARDGRLIPEKDAAKSVLPMFGREDLEEALEEIEDDRAAAQQRDAENFANQAKAAHAVANSVTGNDDGDPNAKKPGAGKPGGAKPPGAAGE